MSHELSSRENRGEPPCDDEECAHSPVCEGCGGPGQCGLCDLCSEQGVDGMNRPTRAELLEIRAWVDRMLTQPFCTCVPPVPDGHPGPCFGSPSWQAHRAAYKASGRPCPRRTLHGRDDVDGACPLCDEKTVAVKEP